MWKKSEPEVSLQTQSTTKRTTPPRAESPGPRKARIGAGLLLKGELCGEEDVIIEGRVEGKITLKQHGVIVEESGRVDADITASTICVAGAVHGNLHGVEQVVLLTTARVEGDIFAKSVTLETGAQFKGSIDMETVGSRSRVASITSADQDKDSASKTSGTTRTPHVAAS
jgi:cytoskeletal protein CcmA (bactofilin family)